MSSPYGLSTSSKYATGKITSVNSLVSTKIIVSAPKAQKKQDSSLEKSQKISDQSTPNYQSAKAWGFSTHRQVEPSLRLKPGEDAKSFGMLEVIHEAHP